MKRRIPLVRILAIAILVAVALLALLMSQKPGQPSAGSLATIQAAVTDKAQETAASYGLPVQLKIPKINVDAPIDQMGLTPEGDMQAPSKPHHAGWYKFGPNPGNKGSAVIAGHYGQRTDGQKSVFDTLHTLGAGDHLYVKDEKGVIATFVVQEFRTYKPNDAAPDVFSSSDGRAYLNLVTCQGAWDATQQTYTDRLVVFSVKE